MNSLPDIAAALAPLTKFALLALALSAFSLFFGWVHRLRTRETEQTWDAAWDAATARANAAGVPFTAEDSPRSIHERVNALEQRNGKIRNR
jgi:hypothetical protein